MGSRHSGYENAGAASDSANLALAAEFHLVRTAAGCLLNSNPWLFWSTVGRAVPLECRSENARIR
jgi:hypothetical protein